MLGIAELFIITFVIAFVIVMIAAQWKIYQKANQPGWACIVPLYNYYVLLKIVGKPGWWLLLLLIPVVNIIFAIWVTNLLSKSFGKDEGFTIGLILLGVIFYPILGFGNSQYIGPVGNPEEFRRYQDSQQMDFGKDYRDVV